MRKTIGVLAVALSLSATAQEVKQPIDMNGAGIHLEKAGKQRTSAIVASLATATLGALLLSVDEDQTGPATGLIVGGLSVGLVLNLSANGHEKKAGRILQGK